MVKEESKNDGITMPCPECQKQGIVKVLFGGLIFEGKSSKDRIECKKCGNLFERKISTKVVVKLVKISILAAALIIISAHFLNFKNSMQALDNVPTQMYVK